MRGISLHWVLKWSIRADCMIKWILTVYTKCPLLHLTMLLAWPWLSRPTLPLVCGSCFCLVGVPILHYIFGHSCCETWSQTYMIGYHSLTFFHHSRLFFFFFFSTTAAKTHLPWFKWMGGLTSHRKAWFCLSYSLNSVMIETWHLPFQHNAIMCIDDLDLGAG